MMFAHKLSNGDVFEVAMSARESAKHPLLNVVCQLDQRHGLKLIDVKYHRKWNRPSTWFWPWLVFQYCELE